MANVKGGIIAKTQNKAVAEAKKRARSAICPKTANTTKRKTSRQSSTDALPRSRTFSPTR